MRTLNKSSRFLLVISLFILGMILIEVIFAPIRSRFSVSYRLTQLLIASQILFDEDAWDNTENLKCFKKGPNVFPLRQRMLKDLIVNVLPGMHRDEIDEIMNVTATHEDMRRDRLDENHPVDSVPQGYFYDEYDWDRLYVLGSQRQPAWFDLFPNVPDVRSDYLIIRFDQDGFFESWFVVYDSCWTGR